MSPEWTKPRKGSYAINRIETMIMIYKVKYISATNTSGAKFQVTRMDDHRVCRTPYKHGVISPVTHAVHDTFGEDPDKLAFVGFTKKGNRDEALWAINHN